MAVAYINDNFQLQDDSVVEPGWKIFEPYWYWFLPQRRVMAGKVPLTA